MISMKEFLEKYNDFKPIYEMLKDYLPENIMVGDFNDLKNDGYEADENVLAVTIVERSKVYFKYIPPSRSVFEHELIHLTKGKRKISEIFNEEIYAYDLVGIVDFMIRNNVKFNPFKIFELKRSDVEEVLRELLGIGTLEEFYEILGTIPPTHTINHDGHLVLREEYRNIRDSNIILYFLIELLEIVEYENEPTYSKILLRLLEKANSF
jgi:hypothetical protein